MKMSLLRIFVLFNQLFGVLPFFVSNISECLLHTPEFITPFFTNTLRTFFCSSAGRFRFTVHHIDKYTSEYAIKYTL